MSKIKEFFKRIINKLKGIKADDFVEKNPPDNYSFYSETNRKFR